MKSSSILVTEPSYRARICHLGACYLAGEYDAGSSFDSQGDSNSNVQAKSLHKRSSLKITGTQGYMAPEYMASGIFSQKTDVFALGVVLLELLSGHEPIRYVQVDEGGRRMKRIGLIETFNILFSEASNNFTGRLRSWIDPRLKDSFPVDCAEWVARIASSCVDPEPGNRPDTRYVAGELSKVFIMSEQWSEQMEANKRWLSGTFEAR
jgi:serine/threonine protein kinase